MAPKFLLGVEGETPAINDRDLGQQMLLYLGAYIGAFQEGGTHAGDHRGSQEIAAQALNAPAPKPEPRFWDAPIVSIRAESAQALETFAGALGQYSNRVNKFRSIFTTRLSESTLAGDHWERNIQLVDEAWSDRWQSVLEQPEVKKHIQGYELLRNERTQKPVDVDEAVRLLEGRKTDLIEKINSSPEIFEAINRRLGMNEHAAPEPGEGYEIFHKGDGSAKAFPYHFAGVVARSGGDSVTFENYARSRKSSSGSDQRMYFQMYGPKREVVDTDTGIAHAGQQLDDQPGDQERRELEQGSFHGRWKHMFVEAQTMVVGKGDEST